VSGARKTALVTGGSRGMGRASAVALARLGYDVAINYSRAEGPAQEAAELVREQGGRLFWCAPTSAWSRRCARCPRRLSGSSGGWMPW
jgi:NAD(P)-dependent dehydrogenase (short-subunit alcohol dehydrogenase family)